MKLAFTINTEDDLDDAIEKLESYRYDLQHPDHVPGEWLDHYIATEVQEDRIQHDLYIDYHRDDLPEGWSVPDPNVMLWHYPNDGFCFVLTGTSLSVEDFTKQINTIKQDITDPIYTPTESQVIRSNGLLVYLPDAKVKHSGENWDHLNTMTLEPLEVQ